MPEITPSPDFPRRPLVVPPAATEFRPSQPDQAFSRPLLQPDTGYEFTAPEARGHNEHVDTPKSPEAAGVLAVSNASVGPGEVPDVPAEPSKDTPEPKPEPQPSDIPPKAPEPESEPAAAMVIPPDGEGEAVETPDTPEHPKSSPSAEVAALTSSDEPYEAKHRQEPEPVAKPDAVAEVPPARVEDRLPEPSKEVSQEFSSTKDRPAVVYVNKWRDGSVEIEKAHPEHTEQILQHVAQIREAARAAIPPEAEYKSPEMDAFFADKDLPSNPVYFLTPEQITVLDNALRELHYAHPGLVPMVNGSDRDVGIFLPVPEVTIVANIPEVNHDPFYREFVVVHEKVHAANGHHAIAPYNNAARNMYDYPRVGLSDHVTGRGALSEEGNASSIAAEYIRNVRGRPYGNWDRPGPMSQDGYYLPPLYVWRMSNGADEPDFRCLSRNGA